MSGVAGAVLTGGASRRMGRDKATLEVAGRPLAVSVAAALAEAGVDPVVAIGGDHERLTAAGLATVEDRWPGEGPLGAILTALRWSPWPRCFVVACDLPWLTAAAAGELLLVDRDAHVVMAFTDRPEPLFAVWDVEHSAPELQAAFDAGERTVRHAVRGLRVHRVEVTDAAALRDVDRPEDLA